MAQGAKSLFQLIVVASHDPNEKVGATGVGQQKYISGRGAVPYSILFENVPTATAPAQEVIVSDSLDPDLDLSTLSLGPITIGGGRQIPIPATFSPAAGLNEVATTVDLRPAQNLFVKLDAKLDPATRLLTVTFASIDPSTGQPPTDPTVGFLPPGAEGSVFFSVKPEQGLTTGTQITNQASVVFDKLAPISTLPWTNTIDATPPTSHILPLPAVENSPSFTVQWAGTDVGSGILDYTIFVSENNGPFTPFISNTTTTSATFTGQSGKSYAFYSIARDPAGNLEDAKTRPEATTQVAADTTPPVITVSATPTTLWPPNGKMAPVTVSGTITDAGSGVNASTATYAVTDEYRSVQPSGKVTLGSNGSYTFTIQLQASRNGNDKDGRQYIITVSAQDNAGNKGVAATGVTVPHDQGH